MRFLFTAVILFFALAPSALAQPSNDECTNPIRIDDVEQFCSAPRAFTNQGATPSSYGPAGCFSGPGNDVWFVFTPLKTTVTITVIGAERNAPGGTLNQPEVALYAGACGGTINELRCNTDQNRNNIVEITRGGLTVGAPLLIRVQGRNRASGSFQLCINNFNPPVEPGQDCPKAAILCNKDPFSVDKVFGPGEDAREADDATCFHNVANTNIESSSLWFTWTAATSGTLTFALTPNNPADDLDFVVYELPNGPLNCRDKRPVRCMASGGSYPGRCMGPTGLRVNETDIGEPGGCSDSRQNNWLAPLDMEAGKSYALFVNNFSDTGNGFGIEFGGTGEFVGPQAAFEVDETDRTVCVGEELTVTDASTFALGAIAKWEWSFGPDASTATAEGQGPHNVSWRTAGTKSIVLTVTSDRGCIVTAISTITVECCADHFSADGVVTDVLCTGQANGGVDLTVTNPYGPYQYLWSNGQTGQDLTGLAIGTYTVTITDAATCDTTLTFQVEAAPPFEIDTLITRPTCNGGTDGAVTLNASGGTPPYEFNWRGAGFGADNNLRNLSSGDYEVIIRDQNGCADTLLIPVRELELVLDPAVMAIDAPTCAGFSDGSIQVAVANGREPFQYDWGDGRGFQGENSLRNLKDGTYQVTVRDANLCRGSFTFNMQAPPPLTLTFASMPTSCNGVDDGEAAAVVSGGVGNYDYRWSNGRRDSIATGLRAGAYALTVTDGNGCTINGQVTVVEPDVVGIDLVEVIDAGCFGEATGRITVAGRGGTEPFMFSVNGDPFQSADVFNGLAAGNYTVTVMDAEGCTSSLNATVAQPPALRVDAGSDLTVKLGFDARLRALSSDPNVSFEWSPAGTLSCTDCPNPLATPVNSTVYTVRIIDNRNCSALDSLRITVSEDRPVYYPNAFSPNDDGINDYFTLFGGPAVRQIKSLRVFDRWGELVFERFDIPASDESVGWDGHFNGKPMNNGVFVFFAEVEFIDEKIVLFEGDITLVR